MSEARTVTLRVGADGRGSVIVSGVDISDQVTHVAVTAGVGDRPEVTVTLRPDAVEADLEANVEYER